LEVKILVPVDWALLCGLNFDLKNHLLIVVPT